MIVQLAGSASAVALLVALAAWARIARPTPILEAAHVRVILAEEFPGLSIAHVWLAADGQAAIARAGDEALVLRRLGDGYVSRAMPWSALARARVRDGQVTLDSRDIATPRARLAWPADAAWPPEVAA